MLDEITRFVQEFSPIVKIYSFEQIRDMLEIFAPNIVIGREGGKICVVAIIYDRGERLHCTTMICRKNQNNFRWLRRIAKQLPKKDIEY